MRQEPADGRAAADPGIEGTDGVVLAGERELISRLPDVPLVIDVGANVGEFTAAVLAARPEAMVVAIEPQATAFERLRGQFGADGRVRLLDCALGARRERRELHSDAPASYLATFHPRPHMPMIETRPVGEVEVRPLAEVLVATDPRRIDLLKIDTEGHELAVLEGARPILDRVGTVLFEHFDTDVRGRYIDASIADFQDLLAGFRLAPLKNPDPEQPTYMWVATKEEAP